MTPVETLNNVSANLVLVAGVLATLGYTMVFFQKHYTRLEELHPDLSRNQHRWLVWPAIVGNTVYARLFGQCSDSFFTSFTWRSAGVTFLLSFVLNCLSVWLIVSNAPENTLPLQPYHLRFLFADFFVFLGFNYFGDLISIHFTRYLLYKIATLRCNFIKNILSDDRGILGG